MTDSNAADVYSFGIMLWAMVVGKEPYEDVENMVQLALQVTQQDKRPPIVPGIPSMLATIMQACWHKEPLMRPTFKVLPLLALVLCLPHN